MMKISTYLLLSCACVAILTSCGTVKSYSFKTAGVQHGDSSYLITASGRHVDASDIDVKPGKVTVDGKPYPLDSISSIKTKSMYFGVSDRHIYLGEVFGKINLLYQLIQVPNYQSSYGTPGPAFGNSMVTGYTTQKKYYIQKSGSTIIDRMTVGTVMDYVSDNDEALQVAKGARQWKRGYLASWAGLAVGAFYGFKSVFTVSYNADGSDKPVSFTGALVILIPSLVANAVTGITYRTRMLKAVEIYNK